MLVTVVVVFLAVELPSAVTLVYSTASRSRRCVTMFAAD